MLKNRTNLIWISGLKRLFVDISVGDQNDKNVENFTNCLLTLEKGVLHSSVNQSFIHSKLLKGKKNKILRIWSQDQIYAGKFLKMKHVPNGPLRSPQMFAIKFKFVLLFNYLQFSWFVYLFLLFACFEKWSERNRFGLIHIEVPRAYIYVQ